MIMMSNLGHKQKRMKKLGQLNARWELQGLKIIALVASFLMRVMTLGHPSNYILIW